MRRLHIFVTVFSLIFLCGCEKRPSADSFMVPQWGEMSAVVELHSAVLMCRLSSSYNIVACGVYLRDGEMESKSFGELVGDAICSNITDLKRNTTYYYRFFITDGKMEVKSSESSFTTLSDAPELKYYYVDEWGINHGKGILFDNIVWAPVNLGYNSTLFKMGKYYQWGRKYGVGYAGVDVENVQIVMEKWGGKNGEEDRNTLYKAEHVSYFDNNNWIQNGDDKFWNLGTEDEPVKTEFDPCPQGWRIPTGKEIDYLHSKFSSFDVVDGDSGAWFKSDEDGEIFLTAGGAYNGDYYGSIDRGNKAFYWSSKCQHSLYFHSSMNYHKVQECLLSEAQNIRCVQE